MNEQTKSSVYVQWNIIQPQKGILKKSTTWMKFEDTIIKEMSQNDQYLII